MSQVINTNMMSLNAQRNLAGTGAALKVSVQRLSTGLRVNSAKDDAAGLSIAERMSTQVRGLNMAARNAADGISFSQTGEGALAKMGDMLQRMRELAVQSANGTNSSADRENLSLEFKALQSEIKRTVDGTKFNGTSILTGSTVIAFQIGAASSSDVNSISVSAANAGAGDILAAFSPTASISGDNASAALSALDTLDKALAEVNKQRSTFGAMQNRFEAAIDTIKIAAENQTAARSRIMDTDFASETAALTRSQVLQQAGTAMLSQANQMPNNVLSLLR